MRNTLLPIIAALCLFIAGVSILNIQLWYSARAESLAGARYAANNINKILDEAAVATRTAITIASKGCDPEEQYQLGTEAALKPHLRTILIIRNGQVWCSSLPEIAHYWRGSLTYLTAIYCWHLQSIRLTDYRFCCIRPFHRPAESWSPLATNISGAH